MTCQITNHNFRQLPKLPEVSTNISFLANNKLQQGAIKFTRDSLIHRSSGITSDEKSEAVESIQGICEQECLLAFLQVLCCKKDACNSPIIP